VCQLAIARRTPTLRRVRAVFDHRKTGLKAHVASA